MNRIVRLIKPSPLLAAALTLMVSCGDDGEQRSRWDSETGATPLEGMSRFTRIDSDREVIVHCGNSMRLAMEWVASEFQKQHGIAVVFNFGGSSELLPLIEMGGRGDLYICHDPYAEILQEKGLLDHYTVVGHLEPILLVPRGNPKNISGLADLGRDNMRLATVDPRYATAGKMIEAALERESWGGAVRRNIVVEARSHADAALALTTGHVDAAAVWNFVAALYPEEFEQIDIGVEFPEEIRVTLVRLTTSENHEEAREFMEFATSDFARKVFTHYGYIEAE